MNTNNIEHKKVPPPPPSRGGYASPIEVIKTQPPQGPMDVFHRTGQPRPIESFDDCYRKAAPVFTPLGQWREGHATVSNAAAKFGEDVGGRVGKSVAIAIAAVPAIVFGALKALFLFLQSPSAKEVKLMKVAAADFLAQCKNFLQDDKLSSVQKREQMRKAKKEVSEMLETLRSSASHDIISIHEKLKSDFCDLLLSDY